MDILILVILGYLLGSVPFGLVLTRLAGTRDLRSIGSGNIGATNVLRTGRKDLAAATLLLDALKGTAAVVLARHFAGEGVAMLAGIAAFLGHLFPVWLRFEGGKGVATFIGVLLALWWPGLVLFAACWLGIAYATRYSSLAALAASALVPAARLTLDLAAGTLGPLAGALLAMAALLWWKHRPNIRRLLLGTEGRIGEQG
ncbi:MAG: glycerol-3-phosphate 1-O-acyltransferase PlsY [Hyphomicrobiales bacterium]|uniref:glycerol-3-phosphate 1-O-acyltransferase PlsY n=1 Tax=Rhabdaerophilum calidifontis TaxID=2604328 RepID=UPI001239A956|nr:glycerol-3-phosphate 1-O-acyltransferase PlsY [Rhabdaerophilum calidifontis]MCA1952933.1 glycerol-3-phosphate 1-O-acyltransferase PlsY [Hyphomicrobiales bacterium]